MGDEDDTDEGCEDAEEFADGEALGVGEGADQEGPDGGRRGKDRGRGDGRVLQASHCEVVRREPENTEGEGEAGGGADAEVGALGSLTSGLRRLVVLIVGFQECLGFVRYTETGLRLSAK